MQADIITIGDEILIGQIVDTNSAFLGKELTKIGVEVRQIHTISDKKECIIKALQSAQNKVDLVVLTGGLGPTKDDITKHTFCDYFEDTLVFNQEVMTHIETLFKKYVKAPVNDLNRGQAMLPASCRILFNHHGTAMGMWMKKEQTVFVSLPGVPFEMKYLVNEYVVPMVKAEFAPPALVNKTMMTYGLGESIIAEKIESWETNLPSHIKLAYLPNLGRVRLRLSAKGSSESLLLKEIDQLFKALYPLIGDNITGFESEDPIELQIGGMLIKNGWKLATAESCTGGSLAALFTQHAGASAYFNGSVVSYATDAKKEILQVSDEIIKEYSVVSEPVALAMAKGVLNQTGADVAVATTGNLGPTKGDSGAEIGTVVIAVITPEKELVQTFCFGKHRVRNLQKALNKSLELLYFEML
ncbi:MAG: CinA family nicotinamide mononucleotide deamidase-related protein [Flavobacteriaceae bacterium]|nr:CinA family nicotinamide mononucleotide deamidase-related protein [Flavobacteriaceae bacterium]